jgi:hypothetical protein
MGKANPKNQAKIVTFEKWLIVTLNWRHYEHQPVINNTQSKCKYNIIWKPWTIISHPP